jgi:hypothetical protein
VIPRANGPAHEVGQQVNLRAQPAAGSPQPLPISPSRRSSRRFGLIGRRILVIRPSPLCRPRGAERPPLPRRGLPRPAVAQPRAATAPTAPLQCPWAVHDVPPRRADAPGPPSSRSRPATPNPGPDHTPPAADPGAAPTYHLLTSDDAANTRSSTSRRPAVDPATAPPYGSATTPHRPPAGDLSTAHPDTASDPATTTPDAPTQRRSDHDEHA